MCHQIGKGKGFPGRKSPLTHLDLFSHVYLWSGKALVIAC